MLREAAVVDSSRTCIAFISLGDGRANVQSIHFYPNYWSRTQLNSDRVPLERIVFDTEPIVVDLNEE